MKKRWLQISNNSETGGGCEILIYGRIGKSPWDTSGIADKEFAEALNTVPRGTHIHLRINSLGGSVKDGLAIYNRLTERRSDITCIIDGMACSTASWIACAAKTVIIPENGIIMIHNPSVDLAGNMSSEELRATADWLDINKGVIVGMYRKRTGRSDQEVSDAMTKETWFTGQDAVSWGLADLVSSPVDISVAKDAAASYGDSPRNQKPTPPAKPKLEPEPEAEDEAEAATDDLEYWPSGEVKEDVADWSSRNAELEAICK